MKKEKGITIVALVITIVIVLILAGIVITQLTGNNGLFIRAKQAKNNTIDAQDSENITIADYENKIDSAISGSRENIIENNDERKQKTMSEQEHFTGEYYLDNKPIYQKTIYKLTPKCN